MLQENLEKKELFYFNLIFRNFFLIHFKSGGPAGLEMLQEKYKEKKTKKFQKYFQVWRACRHSVGNDTMPAGLPNLKCFKKIRLFVGPPNLKCF
jgi:hypothetical protein